MVPLAFSLLLPPLRPPSLSPLVVELVTSGGTGTFNPPSEVVAVAPSSEDLATLTAAAPAFPPGALGFEVEVEEVNVEVALEAPAPVEPRPPPEPPLGSPCFLFTAFRRQSLLMWSFPPQIQQRDDLSSTPSQECDHLQVFPARHPCPDTKYLQGLSMVAPGFGLLSGVVLDEVF